MASGWAEIITMEELQAGNGGQDWLRNRKLLLEFMERHERRMDKLIEEQADARIAQTKELANIRERFGREIASLQSSAREGGAEAGGRAGRTVGATAGGVASAIVGAVIWVIREILSKG